MTSLQEFLALNAELHAISCGGKAMSTRFAFAAVQESRLACGGHGFSFQSSLTSLREFADPFCTFEGDNFVLLQQLLRFLLQKMQKQELSSPMSSLELFRGYDPTAKCSGFSSLQEISQCLNHKACYLLREGASVLADKIARSEAGIVQSGMIFCF